MALDLSLITKSDKDGYIREGVKWPSSWTLAQGHKTLNALEKHGTTLAAYGFHADDWSDLREAVGLLEQAGVTRDGARTDKKADRIGLLNAERAAKSSRKQARSVMATAVGRMKRRGIVGPLRESAESALASTKRAEDGETVGAHLATLAGELGRSEMTTFAGAVATEKAGAATAAVNALRDKSAATKVPHGTPEESAAIDLLDGIVVELVRAAAAAAKATGDKGIGAAFALSELYPKGGGGGGGKPAPTPVAGG